MPKTHNQLFKLFGEKAGRSDEVIHTPDGKKPMYTIYGDGCLIYATCTAALFRAYKELWFLAPDGLYYSNKEQYNVMKSDELTTDELAQFLGIETD